jgi:hypothetical protein
MATHLDATVVEVIIGYSFRSREHLVQALTAAGAEEHNHDGNRKLAHLGSNLLRFILSFVVFEIAPSRSKVAKIDVAGPTNYFCRRDYKPRIVHHIYYSARLSR